MAIDKFYHFVAGTCILVLATTAGASESFTIGLILGAALGKELYDKYIRHYAFDPLDALATCAPIVAILIGMVH